MREVLKPFETFRCGRDLHTSACLCGKSRAYRLVRRRGRVAEGGGLLNRGKARAFPENCYCVSTACLIRLRNLCAGICARCVAREPLRALLFLRREVFQIALGRFDAVVSEAMLQNVNRAARPQPFDGVQMT